MEAAHEKIHHHLLELHARLNETTALPGSSIHLHSLKREVKSALEKFNNGTYGVCELCNEEIEEQYLESDPLCKICFSHLSEEQKTAIEKDLELAYKIQYNLLPGAGTELNGWEVNYYYEPLGPLSGDFYDIISLGEDSSKWLFLFGDVSGKGISAALLMSNLNAIFRTLAATDLPLKELIETANRLFSKSTLPSHFATLVFGRAYESGEVQLSNAGHCRPLLSGDGGFEPIDSTGLPLGIHYGGKYDVRSLNLRKGNTLFLYTDGLTETRDPAGGEYGEERLCGLLNDHKELPSGELIKKVLADVSDFRGAGPVSDDITIMIIKRK
jgi:sigma-B regulation protein RsbU (phosphoserine phosphatase)